MPGVNGPHSPLINFFKGEGGIFKGGYTGGIRKVLELIKCFLEMVEYGPKMPMNSLCPE